MLSLQTEEVEYYGDDRKSVEVVTYDLILVCAIHNQIGWYEVEDPDLLEKIDYDRKEHMRMMHFG